MFSISTILVAWMSFFAPANAQDGEVLNLARDLDGFAELSERAPARFSKEIDGFRSMEGEVLSKKELSENRADWQELADRIRKVLERADSDPTFASVLEIENEAASSVDLSRFFPAFVGRHDRASLVFLQEARKTGSEHLSSLEDWTHTELTTIRERLWRRFPKPSGLIDDPSLSRLPIWLTTDRSNYMTMVILSRNSDECSYSVRYTPRRRAVYGLLSRNHDFRDSAEDDFRIAVALAELDQIVEGEMVDSLSPWVLEGMARLIASGDENEISLSHLRYNDLQTFVSEWDSSGCDAPELFSKDGVTLSCGQVKRKPEETEWRRAAAHAVIYFLREGSGVENRSRVDQLWTSTLSGGNEPIAWLVDRPPARELLEDSRRFATRILRERPLSVDVKPIVAKVDPTPRTDPKSGADPKKSPPTHEAAGLDANPEPEPSGEAVQWVPYLASIANGRIVYARDLASRRGWTEEVARCDLFMGFLGRLDVAMEQKSQKMRIAIDGNKEKLEVVGFEGDLMRVKRDPKDKETVLTPLTSVQPAELTKVAKKLGVSNDEDLACLALWLGLLGLDAQIGELTEEGGSAIDATQESLLGWESMLPEIKWHLEIDALIADRSQSAMGSASKLAKRAKESTSFRVRLPAIRQHLADRLDGITKRRGEFLKEQYPRIDWDEETQRMRFISSFDDVSDARDYFVPEDANLKEFLKVNNPALFKTQNLYARESCLIGDSKSAGMIRFVALLSAPISVRATRTSFIDADHRSLSVTGAPDLVIGIGDFDAGRFIASRGSGGIFHGRLGEIVGEVVSKKGLEFFDSLNSFIPISLEYADSKATLRAGETDSTELEISGAIDGYIYIYAAGVYETRIDEVIIEGTLEPERLDELRQWWIEAEVSKVLGESR